jgi:hypothetical protein
MVSPQEFLKIRKLIADITYHSAVFQHVCQRYDKEDHGQVLSDATLAILDKVQSKVGQMDLDTAFAAGMITYNNLVTDIAATGRPGLDDEGNQATARTIVIKYLTIHKDQYDPAEVKAKLQELQQAAQDGSIEKTLKPKEPEKPSLLKKQ